MIIPALLLAARLLDKVLAVAQVVDKGVSAAKKLVRPKPVPESPPWSYRDVAQKERQIRSAARRFPPKD